MDVSQEKRSEGWEAFLQHKFIAICMAPTVRRTKARTYWETAGHNATSDEFAKWAKFAIDRSSTESQFTAFFKHMKIGDFVVMRNTYVTPRKFAIGVTESEIEWCTFAEKGLKERWNGYGIGEETKGELAIRRVRWLGTANYEDLGLGVHSGLSSAPGHRTFAGILRGTSTLQKRKWPSETNTVWSPSNFPNRMYERKEYAQVLHRSALLSQRCSNEVGLMVPDDDEGVDGNIDQEEEEAVNISLQSRESDPAVHDLLNSDSFDFTKLEQLLQENAKRARWLGSHMRSTAWVCVQRNQCTPNHLRALKLCCTQYNVDVNQPTTDFSTPLGSALLRAELNVASSQRAMARNAVSTMLEIDPQAAVQALKYATLKGADRALESLQTLVGRIQKTGKAFPEPWDTQDASTKELPSDLDDLTKELPRSSWSVCERERRSWCGGTTLNKNNVEVIIEVDNDEENEEVHSTWQCESFSEEPQSTRRRRDGHAEQQQQYHHHHHQQQQQQPPQAAQQQQVELQLALRRFIESAMAAVTKKRKLNQDEVNLRICQCITDENCAPFHGDIESLSDLGTQLRAASTDGIKSIVTGLVFEVNVSWFNWYRAERLVKEMLRRWSKSSSSSSSRQQQQAAAAAAASAGAAAAGSRSSSSTSTSSSSK
jgi:hypothetical protein